MEKQLFNINQEAGINLLESMLYSNLHVEAIA